MNSFSLFNQIEEYEDNYYDDLYLGTIGNPAEETILNFNEEKEEVNVFDF